MGQDNSHYDVVEKAICYIKLHYKEQPSLEEISGAVNLSPFHFQRIFTEWAGVSPKKFIQYLSLEYAKDLLRNKQETLLNVAHETGLSSSSRLHDLFINIESMTPGEFKNGGKSLDINYSFAESPFGMIIVASTQKGICHIAFEDDEATAFDSLNALFPNAAFKQMTDNFHQDALLFFQKDWSCLGKIKLHLNGTPFQLKVWESLLKIPMGILTTYGTIAHNIGNDNASRAVGTAIGSNPVAFLIPCHRVIQSSGKTGGYMWGENRKSAIIGWEASKAGD